MVERLALMDLVDLRKLCVFYSNYRGTDMAVELRYDRVLWWRPYMYRPHVVPIEPGKYMKFLDSFTIGVEGDIEELGYAPDWDYNEPLIVQKMVEAREGEYVIHVEVFNGSDSTITVYYDDQELVSDLPPMSSMGAEIRVPRKVVAPPPRRAEVWPIVAAGAIGAALLLATAVKRRRARS